MSFSIAHAKFDIAWPARCAPPQVSNTYVSRLVSPGHFRCFLAVPRVLLNLVVLRTAHMSDPPLPADTSIASVDFSSVLAIGGRSLASTSQRGSKARMLVW